jgi:hypothetical protein
MIAMKFLLAGDHTIQEGTDATHAITAGESFELDV